jgi:hypothetical protein
MTIHKVRSKRVLTGCGMAIVIGALLLAGGLYGAYRWLSERLPCSLDTYLCVKLDVRGRPRVGTPVELEIDIRNQSVSDQRVDVYIDLPPGVRLEGREPHWGIEIPGEGKFVTDARLVVIQPGEWTVTVHAIPSSGGFGDSMTIYLSGSQEKGRVSNKASPNNWYAPAQAMAYRVIEPDERFRGTIELSGTPSLDGEVTIIFTVSPMADIPDVVIGLETPPYGFEAVEVLPPDPETKEPISTLGSAAWRGALHTGQPVTLNVVYQISRTGSGYVSGYLETIEGSTSGNTTITIYTLAVAYLSVNEYAGSYRIEPGP